MPGRTTLAVLNGRAFTAVLQEDDQKRDDASSSLLSSLDRPDVRIIRMGGPSRPHAMLDSIVAAVIGRDRGAVLADNARLITRTIASQQGHETSVVLLIKQADRLQPKTLRALQAMTPYFAQSGEPTLQVAFVGRPAFRTLLDGEDLAPLRAALALEPDPPARAAGLQRPSGGARPIEAAAVMRDGPASLPSPPPRISSGGRAPRFASIPTPGAAPRRGRTLVRILGGITVLALLLSGTALGLHKLFYRDIPAKPAQTPAAPAAGAALPGPASTGRVTPPAVETPADNDAQVRQTGDQSFAGTRGNGPALLEVQRGTPLVQRPNPRPDLRSDPRPTPRIVIHLPVGSTPAEALSARLVASLRTRTNSVEARRVADTPSRPSIRFFHPEDEPAARQAAAWMVETGLNWTLRDFSSFQPRPSRGTIEVWLPREP